MRKQFKHGPCEAKHDFVPHGEPKSFDLDGDKGLRLEYVVTTYIPIFEFHLGKCEAKDSSSQEDIEYCERLRDRHGKYRKDQIYAILHAIKKKLSNPLKYTFRIKTMRHWVCDKIVIDGMLGYKEWICFNCRMASCEGLEPMPDGKGSWVYIPFDTVYGNDDEEIVGVNWKKIEKKEGIQDASN